MLLLVLLCLPEECGRSTNGCKFSRQRLPSLLLIASSKQILSPSSEAPKLCRHHQTAFRLVTFEQVDARMKYKYATTKSKKYSLSH